jgi:hypothetical protein
VQAAETYILSLYLLSSWTPLPPKHDNVKLPLANFNKKLNDYQ